MKYVCLVYLVENDMSEMTKKEADACTDESLAYDDALRKAGHLIVAHALQPVESATTVRVRNGKLFAIPVTVMSAPIVPGAPTRKLTPSPALLAM